MYTLRREREGHSSIRLLVDPFFERLADTLEDCYYGQKGEDGIFLVDGGWRNGQSRPFLSTINLLSQDDFNALHGIIWKLHEFVLALRGEPFTEPLVTLRSFLQALTGKQRLWLLALLAKVRNDGLQVEDP